MNKYTLLLFSICFMNLTMAEKLEQLKGTSGEYSDIVIDSKGKWYIVKDKSLYHSSDNGVTCTKIEIPSKESVHTGLGLDDYDNIYLQDYKLSVFVLGPNGAFEEITLVYGKERLVSRPFTQYKNEVWLATKSGLMYLENSALATKSVNSPPYSRKEITNLVYYNPSISKRGIYFSGGNPRYWVYSKNTYSYEPVFQTNSFVRYMNAGNDRVYFVVDGEKEVRVIFKIVSSSVTTLNGIDASTINNQTDFVTCTARKCYIYGNSDKFGTIYELGEKSSRNKYDMEVVSTQKLNNVRFVCSWEYKNRLYFGTSNGVYEIT